MEFLNRAVAQLTDLYRSLTPGARIATLLLMVLVPISLAYLVSYRGSGPDVYLMNGESFQPDQIDAMEGAFAKAGLSTHRWEGTRVCVPQGQKMAYVAALADQHAMPQNWSAILDTELKDSSPWVDPHQREQMSKLGKEKLLSAIIRQMKGIRNAAVLYDTETKGGLNRETITRASVSVWPAASESLGGATAKAIRELVAGAIAGLQPQAVTVVNATEGSLVVGGDSQDGPAGSDYLERKQRFEQEWKDKILAALSYVPGALVTTNVELNPEVTNHKESLQHDPKPVPLQVIEDSKTTSSESGEPAGGRPGPVAQQANNSPITLNSSQGKGPTQTADESRSQTVNAMSSTRTVIDSAGLTPKRVTAAISIPQSYFLKIWNKKNAPEAGAPAKMPDPAALDQIRLEETKKISDHVAQLLPSDGTADASQLVKVSTFPDGLTTTEIPLPTTGENVVTWLAEHWTTLGMAALALFALVMLRSMVRSVAAIPSRESAAAAALHAAPGDEAGPVEEQPADKPGAPRLRRYGIAGPSLRDELTQLVQDDPDAAANVLRTWIGSTANNKS